MGVGTTLLRIGIVLLVAIAPSGAMAKLRTKTVVTSSLSTVALALDAHGVPHVAYQSEDLRPYHAALIGKKLVSELVDDTSDGGRYCALGVDSAGRTHMAYHAEGMFPSYRGKLVYALKQGGSWLVDDVDDSGYFTSLALDAEDRAHLFYISEAVYRYARRREIGWEVHTTGLRADFIGPTHLALDANANPHACYARNGGLLGPDAYYATDASGAWTETVLGRRGGIRCALALDDAGHPWVAIVGHTAIALFRHDGTSFSEETVLDFALELPGVFVEPEGIALALGPGGRPHLVVTLFVGDVYPGVEIQLFLAHDGEEWRTALLGTGNAGFDPALAFGPDGTLHAIWRSGGDAGRAKLIYFEATFPDLAGSWSEVAVAGGVLRGRLSVENQGTRKSQRVSISLYLSSDAVLDAGDTPLSAKLRAGGLAPGAKRAVRVAVEVAGGVSGLYLIAVIDPEKIQDDLDRSDNTVAARIP